MILGSIPFVTILTWRARDFGLTRRSAFLITLFLCGEVMLFPMILRSGWIIWWSLSIILLILLVLLCSKAQKTKIIKAKAETETKDETLTSQISICTENFSKEERSGESVLEELGEERSGESVLEELGEERSGESVLEELREERSGESVLEEPDKDTLIEQLIEQGFEAKYSDNLDQAVNLFSKALSLDPIPDLALYLIIDCYWLWNNLGERNYAQTQLQVYIRKYLPQFNSDLRNQFDAWMTKENLHSLK